MHVQLWKLVTYNAYKLISANSLVDQHCEYKEADFGHFCFAWNHEWKDLEDNW